MAKPARENGVRAVICREGIMAHVNPIQVQKFLKGIDYPASKATLLEKAKSMGADDNVCASLEQLPDEDFQTPADVSQAFGEIPDDVEGGATAKAQERKPDVKAERKQDTKAERKPEAAKERKA